MKNIIIENLKREIESATLALSKEKIGTVIEVGDGIVRLAGLPDVLSQEQLMIETPHGLVSAIALNLEDGVIGAVVLGDFHHIVEGQTVKSTGQVLSIPVGQELIGRVVDPLMQPLDGKGPIFEKTPETTLIERPAPSVLMRESVNTPLHTGIKAIDSMIPIGRGQRELIIGDRQIGKTAIAIDTIINQQYDTERRRPMCIYVAIGQRESKIAKIVDQLRMSGALDYTVIVSAPASHPASLWYLAPYAGAAIGEYFMYRGDDALVIYDDLSKHASAYRQISLLLRRPPGREAFPGDIFYLHSRLLERAAKLSTAYGGGSLTALPIIETQLGDVAAYIPTNVISITDGQIYLEPDLFYQGIRPALNIGLSVSRVGSAAQTKAMKKVAGRLRLELAQFRELQAFVQFASDLDESTKKKIARGLALTELLKQNDVSPLPFEQEAIVIWLGVNNHVDDIAREKIGTFASDFIQYLISNHGELMHTVKTTGTIDADTEKDLVKTVSDFKVLITH